MNSGGRQTGKTEKDSGGDAVGPTFVRAGSRPETHAEGQPGEWRHGWQYWSSSVSDSYFRKGTMLSGRCSTGAPSLTFRTERKSRVGILPKS